MLFAAAHDRLNRWVARAELPPLLHESSVEVRARGGELLRAFPVEDGRWRLATRTADVDPTYLKALLAYEDKRFFRHAGVDGLALTRATWQALWNWRIVSGGSTLTMQVARLLENGRTGSWAGKLRQMQLALALERKLGKDEILSLYLTHAPFGGNIEGVRAASYAYFGKEPKRLTPAQVALLVTLPQAPENRRPDRAAKVAQGARDAALARLHEAGVFSQEAANAALRQPVSSALKPFPALAFHSSARAKLEHTTTDQITLTLDAGLQARLESLAASKLAALEPNATIALIVADHTTGETLASIGSAASTADTARKAYVDMTRAIRSPGSALKPLVYAMAFDLGLAHPETLINDAPVRFGNYSPSNFDGQFRGELKLREALQLSLNIPVITLLERVGPERFMQRLRQSGARPELLGGKAGLAVALGGMGLSLHDLVTLYAGFAQGGKAVKLSEYGSGTSEPQRFTSPAAAWQIGEILSSAPLGNARLSHGIAFKTGTSYGYRDNWAVGYDGRYVVGVWVGRADGTPMQKAFARTTAAPLLAQVFQYVAPQVAPLGPPPPETLIVSNPQLPQPLQRFEARDALKRAEANKPDIVFPPAGARLAVSPDMPLMLKLRGGTPPYAVFANGEVKKLGLRSAEVSLGPMTQGFFELSVIDAAGRSVTSAIEIR
ncbi:penicillin-binding protein 1C [Lentibacter sp. XHP0401]|uniref:penicillin-binding protein 1C n=1 Tax=Lentibacter sp. XHP0401 TaxID=2984334 RepID=UPI0021E85066|nr:penicillin-binding protein 1C [Lentibacter sp. XHP0401]MCV2893541.1 penicillin-binding protein 1C [Lentibacter sp. XHP0401]